MARTSWKEMLLDTWPEEARFWVHLRRTRAAGWYPKEMLQEASGFALETASVPWTVVDLRRRDVLAVAMAVVVDLEVLVAYFDRYWAGSGSLKVEFQVAVGVQTAWTSPKRVMRFVAILHAMSFPLQLSFSAWLERQMSPRVLDLDIGIGLLAWHCRPVVTCLPAPAIVVRAWVACWVFADWARFRIRGILSASAT